MRCLITHVKSSWRKLSLTPYKTFDQGDFIMFYKIVFCKAWLSDPIWLWNWYKSKYLSIIILLHCMQYHAFAVMLFCIITFYEDIFSGITMHLNEFKWVENWFGDRKTPFCSHLGNCDACLPSIYIGLKQLFQLSPFWMLAITPCTI